MNAQEEFLDNEKLRLEIAELKQNLEKEEFLKKTLYKQWSELHALILAKESELKLLKSTNLLYKYSFYLILILAVPGYYFLSNRKSEKILTATQGSSSPMPTINKALITNPATVMLPDLMLKEKEIIQPETRKPRLATVNNVVIDQPLTDSVRDYIYWEGWSAYYEKLKNPYKKSTQKYEVWLAGWKEGENDSKKIVAHNYDTLKKQ